MGFDPAVKYKHWLLAALLALITTATFFTSLHSDFMMDDYGLILQESRGHNPANLLYEFIPDYLKVIGVRDMPNNVYYRPWAHVIPLGCYAFFQENPFGYHVVNLILFWLAGLCVYAFILYLFRNMLLAFLTSVLFIIHPINGLTVNYITASVFSFQVIAMMLGLLAGIKSVDAKPRALWVVLGLLGFVNALFCHESALAFPFYLTACLLLVRRLTLKEVFWHSLPFWGFSVLYFLFRLSYASLKVSVLDKITDISIPQYLATFVQLILWYFKCLFTLDGIVLIWSVAIVKDHVWMWVAGLAVVLTAIIVLVIRFRKKTPHVLWLVWVSIAFLPVTLACFFQPQLGLMIEPHWLIVGSVGFFAGVSGLLVMLRDRMPRVVWLLGVALIMACLVATSWSYNRLWSSEQKYCLYWHQQTPQLKSVFFYLAGTYVKEKDWDKAKTAYHRALEGAFLDYEVFNNLGLIAMEEGDLALARGYFLKALETHPNSSTVMSNLGFVLWKQGETDQARGYFQSALDLNPYLIETRLNLAALLAQNGSTQEALALYRQNDEINPSDENNLYGWLNADLRYGQAEQVKEIAQRILKVSEDAGRLTQTGSLLAEHGLIPLAQLFFEKVLIHQPNHQEVYVEAGKMLANINDAAGAVQIWEDGRKKFPGDARFSELISQLQTPQK